MATPQSEVVMPGQTLDTLAARVTQQYGELETVHLTTMVMYAAVKTSQGEVQGMVIPYVVDFKEEAPRDVKYGVYSEEQNPEWAYAPASILNRLTAAPNEQAAEWRRRCWENLQLRNLDQAAWMRGDVLHLQARLSSNKGIQEPGYYVLLERAGDFSKIQRLRDAHGDAKSEPAIVKSLAGAAQKLSLSSDPMRILEKNPGITSFGVVRVMADSEYGSHFVMLGRTAQGGIVPLAKADADERDAMMRRVLEVTSLRGNLMRNYEDGSIYGYAKAHGLTDVVVEQQTTGHSALFDNFEVQTSPLEDRAQVIDYSGPAI